VGQFKLIGGAQIPHFLANPGIISKFDSDLMVSLSNPISYRSEHGLFPHLSMWAILGGPWFPMMIFTFTEWHSFTI
jgi:hypothetical protein